MYKQDGIEVDNEDDMFEKEDSLLIIINEPVSENIQSNIETMYHKGLENLSSGINPILKKKWNKIILKWINIILEMFIYSL